MILTACSQPRPCDPGCFTQGWPLILTYYPFCSFVINLGQGPDNLDLHFNPRFGESTIVCNSLDGNTWGQEQREDHLCFSPGSEVKVRSKGKGPEDNVKG